MDKIRLKGRYILFASEPYEACGGMHDALCQGESLYALRAFGKLVEDGQDKKRYTYIDIPDEFTDLVGTGKVSTGKHCHIYDRLADEVIEL